MRANVISFQRIIGECILFAWGIVSLSVNVYGQIYPKQAEEQQQNDDTIRSSSSWNDTWKEFVKDKDDRIIFLVSLFAVHQTIFIGLNLWLYLIYRNNWFRQYKIQKENPSKELVMECIRQCCINNFISLPISTYLVYPYIRKYTNISIYDDLPTISTVINHCVISFIVNETLFYWIHFTLHHPSIYKYIHYKHHKFHYTIGIASVFAHPIEDLCANVLSTFIGPLVLGSHITVLCLWLALRLIDTIDTHSGYQFPFSPWYIVNGTDRHNFHHTHYNGMYGGTSLFWDWICGTDIPYKEFVKKRRDNKRL